MSFLPDTQSIKQAPASASRRDGGVPPEKTEAGEQLAKYEIESVVGKAARGFTAGLGRRPFAKQKAAVAKNTLPMTPTGSVRTKDGTDGKEASLRMLSFSPDGQAKTHNKHRELQNTGNRRTVSPEETDAARPRDYSQGVEGLVVLTPRGPCRRMTTAPFFRPPRDARPGSCLLPEPGRPVPGGRPGVVSLTAGAAPL